MINHRSEEEIKNHYDSKSTNNPIEAQDYVIDGEPISPESYKELVVQPILNLLDLKSTDSVLDVGCGAGLILKEVEQKVKYAEGIDISQKLIGMFSGYSKVSCGSIMETNLPAASFDKIYMVSVSIHFPDINYFFKTIDKLYNALKPGGALVISDQIIAEFYESDKYFCLSLTDLISYVKNNGIHFSVLAQDKKRRFRNRYDIILYKD